MMDVRISKAEPERGGAAGFGTGRMIRIGPRVCVLTGAPYPISVSEGPHEMSIGDASDLAEQLQHAVEVASDARGIASLPVPPQGNYDGHYLTICYPDGAIHDTINVPNILLKNRKAQIDLAREFLEDLEPGLYTVVPPAAACMRTPAIIDLRPSLDGENEPV